MNHWFRRVRLVTMADLFEDRLGSKGLARFYALFQSLSAMFVVIGFGYGLARSRFFDAETVDGIMRYAQNFAAPMLLFWSISRLDLAATFQPALFLSFYLAAFASFALAFAAAKALFARPLPDCVAIGFVALFSNSLLLGVPITERAYWAGATAGNFAIIALHSPIFYSFGIALMEWARTRGQGLSGSTPYRASTDGSRRGRYCSRSMPLCTTDTFPGSICG